VKPEADAVVPGEVHRGIKGALPAVWSRVRAHLDSRGAVMFRDWGTEILFDKKEKPYLNSSPVEISGGSLRKIRLT
jgi:hypothetical protein